MVLTSEVAELATRIGQEIKAVYSQLAGKAPTSHTHGAADVDSGTLAIARLPVAASGTSSTTAVPRADDSRLSDARVPTAHNHSAPEISSGTLAIARLPVAADGASNTTTVPRADDSRLSNARTPTAHAASHRSNGTDPVPAAIVYSYVMPTAYTNITAAYNSPQAVGTPLVIPDPGFPYVLQAQGMIVIRTGTAANQRVDLSLRLTNITGTEIAHQTGINAPGGTFLQSAITTAWPTTGKLTGSVTLVLGAGMFPSGGGITGQVGGQVGQDPGNFLRVVLHPS